MACQWAPCGFMVLFFNDWEATLDEECIDFIAFNQTRLVIVTSSLRDFIGLASA